MTYSDAQRARIADDHDRWANDRQATADRLTADGRHDAAAIQQRAADERREIANAARTSSQALENVLNAY